MKYTVLGGPRIPRFGVEPIPRSAIARVTSRFTPWLTDNQDLPDPQIRLEVVPRPPSGNPVASEATARRALQSPSMKRRIGHRSVAPSNGPAQNRICPTGLFRTGLV